MPSWLNDALFYEIYPQSFCDSNGDGIGDINGMISKLDYIVDSGFNAIWLNPWFKSENFRDAGYDITDFYRVDPRYGSNEDAARFCAECHKRGIKVLLDLVIGHTAIEHPWFTESCKLEKNRYTDLFIWSPQVNWRGAPDEPNDYYVSGWSPRGAFKANFFAVQPAFNFGYNEIRYRWEMSCDAEIPRRNREVFKDIMRFWLDLGCDGFRVDMAHSVVKRDPEYRKSIEFWQDMRAMFDREYPEAVLVAEWFNPQYSIPGGFHLDFARAGVLFRNENWMSYETFGAPVIMAKNYSGGLKTWLENYLNTLKKTAGKGLIGFFSGNHDRWRMSYFADKDNMIVNMAMLYTLPGCPFLYYGDEIGMRYISGAVTEGSGSRGGSRTPMQWDRSANLGFSTAAKEKLYLPVDDAPNAPVVAEALAGNNPLYRAVCELLALRKKTPALRADADFELLHGMEDEFPLIYRRSGSGQTVVTALNPTGKTVRAAIMLDGAEKLWDHHGVTYTGSEIILPPVSAAIFAEA